MRQDDYKERGRPKFVILLGVVLIFGAILIYIYRDRVTDMFRSSGDSSAEPQEEPLRGVSDPASATGRESYDWGDWDAVPPATPSAVQDVTQVVVPEEEAVLATEQEQTGRSVPSAVPEAAPAASERGLLLETFTGNGLYGVREQGTGRVIIPPEYDFYVDWKRDRPVSTIALRNIDKKYGVVDLEGRVAVPFEFAKVVNTRDPGYWIVSREPGGKGSGLVRKSDGAVVVPFEYDELRVVGSASFLAAKREGLWGIINERNEVILPFTYPDGIGTSIGSDGSNPKVYFTDSDGNSHGFDAQGNRVE